MELLDKTIIVTGASSGIGRAAAILFAAEGAKVVLGARRAGHLEEVAERIRADGGQVVWTPGDVTDEGHAQDLVDLALSSFGSLDGAFNNVGAVGPMEPVSTLALSDWERCLSINLTSAFLAAKAQIPVLQRAGGGSVVFTSSFVGSSNAGLPGMAAYAAAKAGLVGLSKSLAVEHAAAGIRVNALLPGGTITPGGGEGDPDALAFIAQLHPLKRMASAREIAQAALFLLSDRSSFVTASPLLVDGGISARLL